MTAVNEERKASAADGLENGAGESKVVEGGTVEVWEQTGT